jgi:hypothetical protein
MPKYKLTTPVALIFFNRLDITEKIFAEIKKVKPIKLLLIADGPRSNHKDDIDRCTATRNLFENIDWDCEVLKNYSDINMGCDKRVITGLNWVFDNVEDAITLEDDALPSSEFFWFCQDLLEKYRDDKRIMSISGGNFQFGKKATSKYSYYYSRYCHMPGWATWRRAWKCFDEQMKTWPEIRDTGQLANVFEKCRPVRYWTALFDKIYPVVNSPWDYKWVYTWWVNNGLSIIPRTNLVSNIGYNREDATHTKKDSIFANVKINRLDFPLDHPPYMIRDTVADDYIEKIMFSSSFFRQQYLRFRNLMSKIPFLSFVFKSSVR